MRESEITPELIEFSKKAKELGFPQDVENGDWVVMDNGLPELVGTYYIAQQKKALSDRLCLILSFSRCLEWLRGKEWELRTLRESTYRQKGFERWHTEVIKVHPKFFSMKQHYMENAPTHHEAIAKAVVGILGKGSG